MPKITIVIGVDGALKYDVSGVQGKKCKDVTKFIDTLSDKVLDCKMKPEAQLPDQTVQNKGG
jgi:hypothetical protein